MKIARGLCVWLLFWAPMLAFAPQAFAGSPFYLTAERSFSSSEKPQIRLDYTEAKKPVVLRVLRPASLDRFLEGQFQISRSYEEPLSELNPGHYFANGLNRVKSPLRAFRSMLDVGFRQSFKDTPLHGVLLPENPVPTVSPPEKIIHGPPAGFSVAREYYVDLQYGGKDATDPGWWFGDLSWREDRYKIRTVVLDPLPDGVYLIQAVQGDAEAQCLMQVSSLSVQVKQSSGQLLVRVIDRDLNPVPEAAVSFRDSAGRWTAFDKKTNKFGEASLSKTEGILDGKLIVRVETPEGRKALTDTDFLPVFSNGDSVYIVTDRPIFKPGETFFYKGIARAFEKGEVKLPDLADKHAEITLIRADGTPTGLRASVPVTEFGSFSGTFDLDEFQPPGLYRLVAEIGRKPYGGEFRVRDYLKPVFYLEIIDRSPTVVPGEKFFVKFRAKRYSGGAPRDLKFEVFLYRKKFEAPQWVAEAGGGLGAGMDYFGQVRSASALTEPQRVFSSVEARLAALRSQEVYDVANTWDSAPKADESGEAFFELEVPKIKSAADGEWIYTLMIRAADRSGAQSVLSENIFVTLSEAQPVVRFSETTARVGDKGVKAAVRTSYPDGKPAPQGAGVLEIQVKQGSEESKSLVKLPFTTDDRGVCELPLPELANKGRLRAVATLETLGGQPMKRPAASEPALMVVGGAEGETVVDSPDLELYTQNTILSPGQKAKVLALLPAGWGKSESGTIWETISGRKVYDTRPSDFKGRSRWFEVEAKPEYGTGFYQTITVPASGGKYREQTLGFRIVPRDKVLDIAIRPEREETEPLKPFRIDFEVKDSEGRPAPQTELAVTVVDRAVYAVQAEIRPGVLDFFYPLPRLNLATFYSDELQGYGYADILKKPNFKLGALKSQSKPVKKAMRDAAGWFPHVVTDDQGRASVTADLPANVTEWLITAIAADGKGRVGESRGRFRTVSDLSVEVFGPQFLRAGDFASVQVKTANHLDRSVSAKGALELAGKALLREGKTAVEFTLDQRGENLWPLVLQAREQEGVATLKVALSADKDVRVGGAEEFEVPVKPAAMLQIFSSTQQGNMLTVRVPQAGEARELKIQAASGLLGGALSAASVLVSYPYGCTEQLVHSTIPNLVLMDLVQRAGITPEELGPLAAPLTRAQRNAAAGISKIRLNQKTDGGFGFWPSDPSSSVAATLTALYALKYADELKIEGAAGSYGKGVGWVSRQVGGKHPERRSALSGYELSRIAEVGAYDQPYDGQISFVEGLRGANPAPVADLVYALKLFASGRDRDWDKFSQNFKNTPVKDELVKKLQESLYRLGPEDYLDAAKAGVGLNRALGFGFGAPFVLSAAMGVLDDLGALPGDLEARLKRILLSYMKNGGWGSTFDTAQVIFNTRQILSREAAAFAKEKTEAPRPVVARYRNGTELGGLSRIPSGYAGVFRDTGAIGNLAEFQIDGLKADEAAFATLAADVPFNVVKASGRSITVERTFLRITPGGSEILNLSKPLHKGDLIVSEVRVKRTMPEDPRVVPSEFVVVEDGVPSLAQSIPEDETHLADAKIQPKDDTYWAAVKETQRYPDRTVRIAKVLPLGELKIYQVWQVSFAGKAAIPPARAFDMYNEELSANTEALGLTAE